MVESIHSVDELQKKLTFFDTSLQKISFLETYLREHSAISLELLAFIYESLGELHSQWQRKAGFYRKAASMWEMISVLADKDNPSRARYEAFSQAKKNYRLAMRLHQENNSFSDFEELKAKEREIKQELRNYGGIFKTAVIGTVMLFFLISFFLLTPALTGYVTTEDLGDTSYVGFFLTIAALLGVFLILKKWR